MREGLQRDRSSADFGAESFVHIVLKLRESCRHLSATPEEAGDWQTLAQWLHCEDGRITDADIDRLKDAQIAFLRKMAGAKFDASKLPPLDIRDIFERLSPSAQAVEELTGRPPKVNEHWTTTGTSRQTGILIGGVVSFLVIFAFQIRMGIPDAYHVARYMGGASVPAIIAMIVMRLVKGPRAFRPDLDSLSIAAISGLLAGLSQSGAALSTSAASNNLDLLGVFFTTCVISLSGILPITYLITSLLSILAFLRRTGPAVS